MTQSFVAHGADRRAWEMGNEESHRSVAEKKIIISAIKLPLHRMMESLLTRRTTHEGPVNYLASDSSNYLPE